MWTYRWPTAWLLAVLASGCPSPRPDVGSDGDDGAATDDDAGGEDAAAPDAGDVPDRWEDTTVEDGEESAEDSETACEYVGVQVECDPWEPDYVPPPEWEPPVVACGPGCRQISWGAYRLSVWDRQAALMRDRRLFAVDLDTLEHRQLACEHAPVELAPEPPVWPDLIASLSLARNGGAALYARDLTVPGRSECDDMVEFRIVGIPEGDDLLVQTLRAPSTSGGPGCTGIDLDQIRGHDGLAAFVMREVDCWSYLFALDLDTGAVRRYDGSPGGLFLSEVWNGKVALATPGEVYLVDLETGSRVNLSDHPDDQTLPAMHENRVVWEDYRHTSGGFGTAVTFDVYAHHVVSGETRRVTRSPSARFPPRVFDDVVVWSDVREAASPGDRYPEADIWMFDLTVGEERQVTALPGTEYELVVWGDHVYFRWRRPDVIHTMDEALCECPLPAARAAPDAGP